MEQKKFEIYLEVHRTVRIVLTAECQDDAMENISKMKAEEILFEGQCLRDDVEVNEVNELKSSP